MDDEHFLDKLPHYTRPLVIIQPLYQTILAPQKQKKPFLEKKYFLCLVSEIGQSIMVLLKHFSYLKATTH